MQNELLADNPATRIRLGAINQIGSEGSAEAMCDGRDIPLLQDTYDDHAWAQWQVTYRDVIILDEENRQVAVYNLTTNSLSYPENYAELKALLLSVAGE
ncbi:MAG: hypothetical protein ACYTF8_03960 [Planctomycetota bacterium]|jgi:hypothetical protein